MEDYTTFDLETTGFLPKGRIIEIGAVRRKKGIIVGTFQMLVKQQPPFNPEAMAVNNIKPEWVAMGYDEEIALRLFANFCRGSVLVAHNYPFDGGMLNEFYTRVVGREHYAPAMCTKSIAKFLGDFKSVSLANICLQLGIARSEAHRALGDALDTDKLFHEYLLPRIDPEEHLNRFNLSEKAKQLSLKYEYFK